MQRNTIVIILIVVIGGVALGAFLSTLGQNKKGAALQNTANTQQTPGTNTNLNTTNPPNSANVQKPGEVGVGIQINPNPVKVLDASIDITKDLAKADKALITISYQNNSKVDLTGVQIWIDTTNPNDLGYADTEDAKSNKDQITKTGRRVYDVPDVKAGKSAGAHVWVYSKKAGKYKITADITSTQGKTGTTKSSPVTLTIR